MKSKQVNRSRVCFINNRKTRRGTPCDIVSNWCLLWSGTSSAPPRKILLLLHMWHWHLASSVSLRVLKCFWGDSGCSDDKSEGQYLGKCDFWEETEKYCFSEYQSSWCTLFFSELLASACSSYMFNNMDLLVKNALWIHDYFLQCFHTRVIKSYFMHYSLYYFCSPVALVQEVSAHLICHHLN